jgi:hypothetical protein
MENKNQKKNFKNLKYIKNGKRLKLFIKLLRMEMKNLFN